MLAAQTQRRTGARFALRRGHRDSRMRSAALGAQGADGRLVGTADLYDDAAEGGASRRMARMFPTTRDYRTLLDRKDVDAVIVAYSDHQHRRVMLDAVAAGKDVYCEKPMSHSVADGLRDGGSGAGEQAHLSGRQPAGEQSFSTQKAREIFASGRLGEVHVHRWRTGTATRLRGAWVYPIPPDASPETIDWKRWLVRCAGACRLTRCGSSAGAALGITVRGGRATCLCICCRASSASRGMNASGQPRLLERRDLPLQGRARLP